jgi:hypothetical protein
MPRAAATFLAALLLAVLAGGAALMATGVGAGVAMVGVGVLGVMFAGLGTAETPAPDA